MKRILEFKAFESLSGLSEEQKVWLDKCTRGRWSVGADGKVDVKGDFNCSSQNLEGFKGVRFGRVSGGFYCHNNDLTSLEGVPESVGEDFYCYKNRLETLEGAPETVGGGFSSDLIEIPEGQWGISGWLKVLEEGSPEGKKLIATLITPEALNKRLEESPERTMVALKGIWNSSEFAKIRSQLEIPNGYEDEMDLLGDLDDIGL
jgi:hypothetical protein